MSNDASTPVNLQKTSTTPKNKTVGGGNIWEPEDNTAKPAASNYSGHGYSYYGLGSTLAKIFFFTLPIPLVILLTTQMNNVVHTLTNVWGK